MVVVLVLLFCVDVHVHVHVCDCVTCSLCAFFFEKVGDSTVLYSADPKQLCELNFTLSQF